MTRHACVLPLLLQVMFLTGCADRNEPAGVSQSALAASASGAPAPAPLVTVTAGGGALTFWPFAGDNFAGAPVDPINLIFTDEADPRGLRAALLLLDGDRTAFGFPNAFPFNCTWSDAIGGVETAYGSSAGWVAGAMQLACGPYGPLRFHLRFFDLGRATIGNVHFEVLIPGTADHAVLSWELAEQLVVADFVRSGLLDPSAPLAVTGSINPSPFRDIHPAIYNGLPTELRAAIGGPLGNVTAPVPIATDGRATVLNLAGSVSGSPAVARQEFVIQFGQVIPKPFCTSGPADFLLVQGPVQLRQQIVLTRSGNYESEFHAQGHLDITPVNVSTNPPTPIGETFRAQVNEHHAGVITDAVTMASSFLMQLLIPPSALGQGRLTVQLRVGPGGRTDSAIDVRCGS